MPSPFQSGFVGRFVDRVVGGGGLERGPHATSAIAIVIGSRLGRMSVVEDAIKSVQSGLDFKQPLGRLQGAYARRRVASLHGAQATWDVKRLAKQVNDEIGVVTTYIKGKKSITDATDSKTPQHLDLVQAAKDLRSTDPRVTSAIAARYASDRSTLIPQIAWRALTVHFDQLWTDLAPTLNEPALDELLDRRLRVIEQMTCNVNGGLDTPRSWSVSAAAGPWKDGFQNRNFEYPFVEKKPFAPYLTDMTNAGWEDTGTALWFKPGGKKAGVHVPAGIASAWKANLTTGGTLWVVYQSTSPLKPHDVIQRMFNPPRANWYDRNWLYCDMVGSALNLEALWFGLHRRKSDDADFDTVMTRTTPPGYIALGPLVNFAKHDLGSLMADPGDAYFENLDIAIEDLQPGDFTCFWSGRVYSMLRDGAWGNEFSHVMAVDVDPKTGGVKLSASGPVIKLAGHGLATTTYQGMAADLVKDLANAFDDARKDLAGELAKDPTTKLVTTSSGETLELWSPYEAFDTPGAWWLRIPQTRWQGDWKYASIDDVLTAVPRTVADAPGGTGYQAPADTTAVYFPLFQPHISAKAPGDQWHTYLAKRKASASYRAPKKLDPLANDWRLAVGLYYHGTKAQVTVVRPKVRP